MEAASKVAEDGASKGSPMTAAITSMINADDLAKIMKLQTTM